MAEPANMFIEGIKDALVRNSVDAFYAIAILVLGYIIAVTIAYVVRKTLVELKVDRYITEKGKTPIRLSSLIGTVVKWYLMLIVLQVAVGQLGRLDAVAVQIQNLISFMPTIIEAGVVLFLIYVIGTYIKDEIFGDKEIYSSIVGQGVFFILVLIGIVMSLSILGIDTFLISAITLVILGSAGLGFAIAVGLGLKDSVAEIAEGYLKKHRKK
ncbi:MAG: hypothetical protein ABIG84_03000 [archaeon]